jgi:hypothetical protein
MSTTHDAELQALLDRQAIQELIFRYSDAVTRGDYDPVIEMFAPDAVWDSPILGFSFTSARDFVESLVGGTVGLDVLAQTASNPVIELLDREHARATTTMREMVRGSPTDAGGSGEAPSEINEDRYAIYFDEIARIHDAWKFTRRVFVPFLLVPGGVVGDAVSPRPLLRPE